MGSGAAPGPPPPAAAAACRRRQLLLGLPAGQHGDRRGRQQCRGTGSRAGGGPYHPPLGHRAAAAGAQQRRVLLHWPAVLH